MDDLKDANTDTSSGYDIVNCNCEVTEAVHPAQDLHQVGPILECGRADDMLALPEGVLTASGDWRISIISLVE